MRRPLQAASSRASGRFSGCCQRARPLRASRLTRAHLQNMKLADAAPVQTNRSQSAMLLSSLLGADMTAPAGADALDVKGITADSRCVQPGFLFVAIPGTKADGARFVADAQSKGAVAIVAAADADL